MPVLQPGEPELLPRTADERGSVFGAQGQARLAGPAYPRQRDQAALAQEARDLAELPLAPDEA